MVPHVIYIFSAILLSSFTRSVTIPIFFLCVCTTFVYFPYLEQHDKHFFEQKHLENFSLLKNESDTSTGIPRGEGKTFSRQEDTRDMDSVENVNAHHHLPGPKNLHEKIDYVIFSDSETFVLSNAEKQFRKSLAEAIDLPPGLWTPDQFSHYHLYYQFKSMAIFVVFTFVGYTLSRVIRYPPIMDSVYLRDSPFYCLKVFVGLLIYHLLLFSVFVFEDFTGSVFYCLLSIGWSFMFYTMLTIEDVRWQTAKSIRIFLFLLNIVTILTMLLYVTGVGFVTRTTHTSLIASIAIFDLLFILLVRFTIMKARRVSTCSKLYASDKHQSVLKKRWFGFAFGEQQPDENATMIATPKGRDYNPLINPNKNTKKRNPHFSRMFCCGLVSNLFSNQSSVPVNGRDRSDSSSGDVNYDNLESNVMQTNPRVVRDNLNSGSMSRRKALYNREETTCVDSDTMYSRQQEQELQKELKRLRGIAEKEKARAMKYKSKLQQKNKTLVTGFNPQNNLHSFPQKSMESNTFSSMMNDDTVSDIDEPPFRVGGTDYQKTHERDSKGNKNERKLNPVGTYSSIKASVLPTTNAAMKLQQRVQDKIQKKQKLGKKKNFSEKEKEKPTVSLQHQDLVFIN